MDSIDSTVSLVLVFGLSSAIGVAALFSNSIASLKLLDFSIHPYMSCNQNLPLDSN